jgi:hypothetical protein
MVLSRIKGSCNTISMKDLQTIDEIDVNRNGWVFLAQLEEIRE